MYKIALIIIYPFLLIGVIAVETLISLGFIKNEFTTDEYSRKWLIMRILLGWKFHTIKLIDELVR